MVAVQFSLFLFAVQDVQLVSVSKVNCKYYAGPENMLPYVCLAEKCISLSNNLISCINLIFLFWQNVR